MGKALCAVDRIQLDGKIAVLQSGNLETGQKRWLRLFRRGNELDLQKDGKPAGRLLLINIDNMVLGTRPAQVEVDYSLILSDRSLASYQLALDTSAVGPESCNESARFLDYKRRVHQRFYQRTMATACRKSCLHLVQSSVFLLSQVSILICHTVTCACLVRFVSKLAGQQACLKARQLLRSAFLACVQVFTLLMAYCKN